MPKRRKITRGRPPKTIKKAKKETVEEKPRFIEFSLSDIDPIVEHLKEYSKIDDSFNQLSLDTILLDQIALEGLSGITVKRLFNIVEALFPNLPCTVDYNCQRYVWSIVLRDLIYDSTSHAGIKLFYLDPKRENQLDCDNTRGVVIDKVIKLPSQTVKRIAKSDSLLSPVQDGLIMGSCSNYLSRVEITRYLVEKSSDNSSPMECMYFLEDQYGLDNVFIVANQTIRAKAILPDWADPNVDIKLREYCALELIGRSRSLGTVFPNDKALGRYRIMLEAKGFITQFQANMSSPIEHHLKRFANCQQINQTTGNVSVALKSTSQGVNGKSATLKAKQSSSKATRNKKVKVEEEDEEENTGLADSDSDDEDKDADSLTISALFCDPSKLKPNRNILSAVYDVIAESGGISQIDLRRELHMPRFHLRNHLKNLISLEMVCTRPPKDGDGSLKNYFAPKASKRKKIKEEMLASTGIMASWDEADLRAKKIIGHKRSSFSQAEDSILILCRIASVLIEPRLKLSWCVNKRLIRDLLHKELVEAHDKTSDACLRRIKYLKKLPNNIMSINELTAELQDDGDVKRLLRSKKLARRANKRFLRLFKCVRTKIPNLLGIPCSISSSNSSLSRQVSLKTTRTNNLTQKAETTLGSGSNAAASTNNVVTESSSHGIELAAHEINDHEMLRQKYDLIDCQSLASIQRASTYETPKNVVDVKLNQASLVTMAFTMTSCFGQFDGRQRRTRLWLLDKFYSNYHDKLISSMLSKLNKRSLLTRKCPTSSDPLASSSSSPSYFAKTRLSLKLNQSVLFLLNRYQSHSLIQLANPISRSYSIDLCESNEMASIAMLTSLCSFSAFNLDMDLRIPTNVVGIDQGNENFKSLCEKVNPGTREILARFMSRCGEGSLMPEVQPEAERLSDKSESGGSGSSSCDVTAPNPEAASSDIIAGPESLRSLNSSQSNDIITANMANNSNKMDDSRRALFLLRHELKTQALDKCGSLADCLIVQPCNVKFYSNQKVELPSGVLEAFLERSEPLQAPDVSQVAEKEEKEQDAEKAEKPVECDEVEDAEREQQLAAASLVVDKWLVKGYSLSSTPPIVTTTTTTTTTTANKHAHNGAEIDAAPARGEGGEKGDDAIEIRAQYPEQDCGIADKKSAPSSLPEQQKPKLADQEEDLITDVSFEARKRPIEFYARAWKQIDGKVHLATLFKLIESILSWLIVLPGVELGSLEREFCHLLPEENLHELLGLMEELGLISSERLRPLEYRPRLFGFRRLVEDAAEKKSRDKSEEAEEREKEEEGLQASRQEEEGEKVVYESTANAYVKYCQLLSYCNQSTHEL